MKTINNKTTSNKKNVNNKTTIITEPTNTTTKTIKLYKLDYQTYICALTTTFDSLLPFISANTYMWLDINRYDKNKNRWCIRMNGETLAYIKINKNNIITNIYLNKNYKNYNIFKELIDISKLNKYIGCQICY